MEDTIYRPITQLADLLRTGKISPVELIEATFAEIDRHEPRLNAFIFLFREQSLELAKQAEAEIRSGHNRGLLHGIPIALKDIINVSGAPTTCGSKRLSDNYATSDATVVAKLKQAGAIIIGKTNLHEFAFGVTTENPHFGTTANPWDVARVPGGSSGGSAAAVISGFCAGALGTDTGGSIRIPAALCGNVGLKPTYGRVSVHGVVELAQSLDCVGPMCRYVQDVAIMMNTLSGHDARDVHSENQPVDDYTERLGESINGWKIGIPKQHFFDDLHPEVESAVDEAIKTLSGLGVEIVELNLPSVPEAHDATLTILMAEAGYFHRQRVVDYRDSYGADVRELLEAGKALSAADYIKAVRAQEITRREFSQAFERVDLMVLPTVPILAPLRSGGSESNRIRPRLTQNTRIFNLLGLPAISVPCGFTQAGLPIGLQIVGKWWSEKTLLQAAYTYEKATLWHTRNVKLNHGVQAEGMTLQE